VSEVLTRVLDKLCQKRFSTQVEALGLRAATQCGFRPDHGTLDAVFTIQHLISSARYHRRKLYVIFIDFKKAFDMVSRQAILDRCKQLGVHGEFLNRLMLLYERVQQQVCIQGQMGELFDTYVGTKQGSELSPLLFGLFIDQLHELLVHQVPGAGPVVGNLRVPDVTYADDGTLIHLDDFKQVQCMLECLHLFCLIFGMEVNTAPDKTSPVVFRAPGTRIPKEAKLCYAGKPLDFKDKYKHLGLFHHATKGVHVAANALAASADKALKALHARCRVLHITQFAFKCRLFDTLVEPILSYGSHVWGPMLIAKHVADLSATTKNQADKLHTWFLRSMAGAGKSVSISVLLQDFNRLPIWHRWIKLAARWWVKVRDMTIDRLAHNVWLADVQLMLEGCQTCWAWSFLRAMTDLKLIDGDHVWNPAVNDLITTRDIAAINIDPDAVQPRVKELMLAAWASLSMDPRSAPSERVQMCTYAAWVAQPVSGSCTISGHKHLLCCSSFKVMQCLARYRIGAHQLQVQVGRTRCTRVPREQRLCRLCSVSGAPFRIDDSGGHHVEDLLHFMLECPAYAHIRRKFPTVFQPSIDVHHASANNYMWDLMQCSRQEELAACVYLMDAFRTECLKLPRGTVVPVGHLLGVVDNDIALIVAYNDLGTDGPGPQRQLRTAT
jgi:sorting nexin-29